MREILTVGLFVAALLFGLGYRIGQWMQISKTEKMSDKPMRRRRAQKRLREIWREQHPGTMTIEEAFVVSEPWKWFNIYANLQNHNETMQSVSIAFAEALNRRSKENHHLQEIISNQRTELVKRLSELDAAKAGLSKSGNEQTVILGSGPIPVNSLEENEA